MVCSVIEQVGIKKQKALFLCKVAFQESQDSYRTFKDSADIFSEFCGIPCFPVICWRAPELLKDTSASQTLPLLVFKSTHAAK